jgi:hypothetical protein
MIKINNKKMNKLKFVKVIVKLWKGQADSRVKPRGNEEYYESATDRSLKEEGHSQMEFEH